MELAIEELDRRYSDTRGELAVVLDHRDPPAEVVELVEFAAAGDVRGEHVHDQCREVVYVAAGTLHLELLHPDGGVQRERVAAGTRVRIPPGIGHRFTACEPSRLVCLLSGGDPAQDRRAVAPQAWSAAP